MPSRSKTPATRPPSKPKSFQTASAKCCPTGPGHARIARMTAKAKAKAKPKRAGFSGPRPLTPPEIESLRQDKKRRSAENQAAFKKLKEAGHPAFAAGQVQRKRVV